MLFVLSLASAAPRFVADHPEDAGIAHRAWLAAEACTGWSGRAHEQVELVRGRVRLGFRGLASEDEGGLFRVDLDAEDPDLAEVIVHEIAHAWVSHGPTALVEGRTELLADCIAMRAPGIAPLQWDDGRVLPNLPALKTWDAGDGLGPSVNPLQRTDTYLGAARLVRLAALVLPERALWPEEDELDWDDLDRMLAESGEPAKPIRALLGASGPEQARALSDQDGDGLPELGEQIFQTDPTRFDTDGDGWWDGASVRPGTRPLPFDGTPVCTGWATPPVGTTVRLQTGGNLRGVSEPRPVLHVGPDRSTNGQITTFGLHSVLVGLEGAGGEVSGGMWAEVDGDGLIPDEACVQGERVVAWAVEPHLRARVADHALAVEAALLRMEDHLGGAPVRVAVSLGGPRTTVQGAVIHLSTEDVRALAPDVLAAQVVAMRRVWDASNQRDWRDVQALARHLLRLDPDEHL